MKKNKNARLGGGSLESVEVVVCAIRPLISVSFKLLAGFEAQDY